MKKFLVTVIALALVVPAAWAGGLAGVKMDEKVVVGSDTVKLNGMGLRKKLWVNVWVGDSPPTDEFKKGVLGG